MRPSNLPAKLVLSALGVVLSAGLLGCTPKAVPPTTQRAAITPAEVQLLTRPPLRSEDLGFIFSDEIASIPDGWTADPFIVQLKTQAAALGANTILIAPLDFWSEFKSRDDRYVYVGGFYNGKFFTFPVTSAKPRKMIARAIFVNR